MSDTNICPRCGGYSLEHLATHSNCWECDYSPDFDSELSSWERMELPYFKGKFFSRNHINKFLDQKTYLSDPRA